MKHKATKYKENGEVRTYVLEFRPQELAAIYQILGCMQSNHLADALSFDVLDLISQIGNIGNVDFEDGWNEVVGSSVRKWIPVSEASEFCPHLVQP